MTQNSQPLGWGILGTGNIARKVSAAIQRTPGCRVAAVGSRRASSAQELADRLAWPGFSVPRAHGSYEDLAADPDVRVIYITSPHAFHADHIRLALEAGKDVLCEKPLTLNAAEAEPLIQEAREKKRFLMEALWTRFFPALGRIRRIIASGELGEIRRLEAAFCIDRPFDPEHRLYNPRMGGGALLDLGIYPLSWADFFLGLPRDKDALTALVRRGPTGVDHEDNLILRYSPADAVTGRAGLGATAALTCALGYAHPREGRITGTRGWISVPENFHHPHRFTLTLNPESPREEKGEETFPLPPRHEAEPPDTPSPAGYEYEIEEVRRCLKEGLTESPAMPLAKSLEILKLMDRIRHIGGVSYPGEKTP